MASIKTTFTPEQLISHLSHRPQDVVDGMITVSPPVKPEPLQRSFQSSSLGSLDKLPLEILQKVFFSVDIRSLSRICGLSARGKHTVEYTPPYRNLMKHAPEVMAALGKTGLAGYHKLGTVYSALRSEKCVSCKGWGGFLFLLTCERCCCACLERNPALWAIPFSIAVKFAGLDRSHLIALPVLHGIPGSYWNDRWHKHPMRYRLIGLQDIRQLALSVPKALDTIRRSLLPSWRNCSLWRRGYAIDLLEEMCKAPVDQGEPILVPWANTARNHYLGLVSIELPSLLPDGTVSKPYWCLGCEKTLTERAPINTALGTRSAREANDILLSEQRRARSRSEFLEHITECEGAQKLMSGLGASH